MNRLQQVSIFHFFTQKHVFPQKRILKKTKEASFSSKHCLFLNIYKLKDNFLGLFALFSGREYFALKPKTCP